MIAVAASAAVKPAVALRAGSASSRALLHRPALARAHVGGMAVDEGPIMQTSMHPLSHTSKSSQSLS